ncbi:hypothetical protein LY71_104190 [Geodermatophilus tzadiensis]|uniref:Uncharacterized protein n=1 Tax=Geodermatophilus tzadiensis TaxID=1137988 RepID=A0A2T0TWX1_9ACTN|nr:hypothetical protein [Geodermatophilus tzadiensis]PRY50153.1 hypothetical protein LY71_104190 [Geodermatophilus tzadiensis]
MSGPLPLPHPGRRSPASRVGRAVDRPLFWWSAAAVFLANAGLSVAEDRWALAVLHALTCLWAVVAGVTVSRPAPGTPGLADDGRGTPARPSP